MKSSFYLLVAGLSLLHFSAAQILEAGSCNKDLRTANNFDPSRYLGRWYENQKYPFIFEKDGKCIYAEYGTLENGDISVHNLNINQLTGKPNDIKGSAKTVANGKLKVKFAITPALVTEADYWVLDTDYDNFAVVYSCTDFGGLVNGKVVWILTRERQPQSQYIERARNIVKENGLSLDHLNKSDQTGCE